MIATLFRRLTVASVLPFLLPSLALTQTPQPPPGAPPSDATTGMEATVAATQDYLKTGTARTVQMGDFRAFPYGKSQPTLTCAPLRTCIIRLQAGEQVLGAPALGDSERWITGVMATGPDGATPLIYVKPTACDLTTNLIISTDRHLYNVMLDAPPCPTGVMNRATEVYTWHLTFYYPEETAQQWAAATARRATDIPLAASPSSVALEQLHFNYQIKKDRHFPWTPEHVFDDGVHLYLKRPPAAHRTAAPVLFGVDADGSRAILNYTLRHDYYVTDRVVDRVVLVMMDGGKERTLELTRRGGR